MRACSRMLRGARIRLSQDTSVTITTPLTLHIAPERPMRLPGERMRFVRCSHARACAGTGRKSRCYAKAAVIRRDKSWCVYLCVCVRAREPSRAYTCVHIFVCASFAYACARVYALVCVCVFEHLGKHSHDKSPATTSRASSVTTPCHHQIGKSDHSDQYRLPDTDLLYRLPEKSDLQHEEA